MQGQEKAFTVIGFNEADGQTVADFIMAETGEDAMRKFAQNPEREGHVLVVCLGGKVNEKERLEDESILGALHWPGDGIVDVETYLEMWGEDL